MAVWGSLGTAALAWRALMPHSPQCLGGAEDGTDESMNGALNHSSSNRTLHW
eukprot:CAMPEP_0174364340 /NCGR_PEP_ID=MMETSP0811_2-20130205/72518_1 /TAXON_ID=73025 ORGANISM="Eutreptiella gymnastica-like, Strain CCMP1594" /NCGR_SAMPLE_ID=MMETSP0811_2 /ASSEMBLY_ACC=CAM_ASM_000667 /LENGTH=51 /DNA_ID=CAMNT_0015503873 /DNA_START=57 /DNA_END=209 /DNA_ORIENTATION=+